MKALLDELKAAEKLTSGTKWKEVYPFLKDDERYLSLLGLPGSTPLELFWDAVDQLDQALESKVKDVEKYLSGKAFKFTEQTTIEELVAVLKEDEEIAEKTENDGLGLYRYVGLHV